MILFLSLLCGVMAIALAVSAYYLLKFGKTILAFEDSLDESLDILDRCYAGIAKILQTPVGSDDPVVRSVIKEIKQAQGAILLIANKITTDWREKEDRDG